MREHSLEPLVTQCPTCRTRFRVTDAQLNAASGRVRCGACLAVFTGLEHLVVSSGPRLRPGESANAALDALLDELRRDPEPKATTHQQQNAQPQASVSPQDERSRPIDKPLGRTARAQPDEWLAANAAQPATLSESKPAASVEPKPAASVESKSGTAVESKSATTIESKSATSVESKPAAAIESRSAPPAESKPPATIESKPVASVESKPHVDNAAALDGVAARRARRLRLAAASAAKPREIPPDAPKDDAAVKVERAVEPPPVVVAPEPDRAPAPAALELTPEELIALPTRRRRRWWLPLGVLVAIVLLAAQVLYLQFDTWTKNPDIRPIYEWLCPYLQCELPVMRSLDEIRSKNLVVRANHDVPGELLVDALIVNEARFAQPFPVIELRFSSMEGRPIAARRFKPEEYLAGELKGATMFAPMTPVHIALAIEDPGTDAVSYYIQFR